MKQWKKLILLTGILSMMSIGVYGCSSAINTQCKEVIESFETSCNELDVKGVLNCINPKVSDPIKAVLALTNVISDQKLDGYLVEIIGSIAGELSESIAAEDVSTSELLAGIQITPKKYKMKSKKGTVYCTATFKINEMEITKYIGIDMIKSNGEWYISGMALAEEKE